jgi:hypothetical protein
MKEGQSINHKDANRKFFYDEEVKRLEFLDTRLYKVGKGQYYPSVTTILQYFPKNKFFENWIKDVGHNSEIILRKAAKEGTQVHEAAEQLLKGEEISWLDENGNAKYDLHVWEMILRFQEFWTTAKPKLLLCEEFLYSHEHEYAGTMDILCELDNEVWEIDIKTSNSLHKTYDLQLAAYVKALEEKNKIKVDRTGILWLKAATRKASTKPGVYQGKKWQLKPVDNIEENFELFKNVKSMFDLENADLQPEYLSYPTTVSLKE